MSENFKPVRWIPTIVASLLLGALVFMWLDFPARGKNVNAAGIAAEAAPGRALEPQGLPDFVSLAKKLGPAFVNISTTQGSEGREQPPFGEDDPSNEFWRRFFGAPSPRGQY